MNLRIVVLVVVMILGTARADAQQITVSGGNIVLAITTATAGAEPIPAINTATSLRYRRQTVITKITVGTVCPAQKFSLSVVSTSAGAGVPAPEVTLLNGMLPVDFITGIPPRPPSAFQTAALRYTASATFSQGNSAELGDDVHTVTYTLVAQ